MAEGKCAKCSRFLLVIFNLFFWICGALCLGAGIWVRVDEEVEKYLKRLLDLNMPVESLFVLAYILMAVGAFVFVVGFCGCCGAVRESAWMLGVFIGCMLIIIIAEIGGGIYFAVERVNLETMLRDNIAVGVKNYTGAGNSTLDFIQQNLKCCGSENYTDYEDSYFFLSEGPSVNMYVPESCCTMRTVGKKTVPINATMCQLEAKTHANHTAYLYKQGCFKEIVIFLDDHSLKFIFAVVGLGLIEIMGIAFAVSLCRNRTEYYDD
ncbi:hypothetical protein ScPMuIL_016620 [Solemya velum]